MPPRSSSADKEKKAPTKTLEPKPTGDAEKKKALETLLQKIEKDHGKGSIMRLGDAKAMVVETISSGSLTLDLALGGGLPRGRVIEIYGPESSGKTTLILPKSI